MKTITKVLAALVAFVGLIGPAVTPALSNLVAAHSTISLVLGAISTILALFHNPTATPAA